MAFSNVVQPRDTQVAGAPNLLFHVSDMSVGSYRQDGARKSVRRVHQGDCVYRSQLRRKSGRCILAKPSLNALRFQCPRGHTFLRCRPRRRAHASTIYTVQVPVVISDGKEVPGDAIKAAQFLNISLHQSQVVTSPGFVVVYHNKESIEVASYGGDGNVLPP